mmetsp:Transcript_20122/g.65828  ORF Transcript_20122/g.65828 Transcript_20122/m.65828 type:complete len:320 (-) Transcript_20122:1485-2444(-)
MPDVGRAEARGSSESPAASGQSTFGASEAVPLPTPRWTSSTRSTATVSTTSSSPPRVDTSSDAPRPPSANSLDGSSCTMPQSSEVLPPRSRPSTLWLPPERAEPSVRTKTTSSAAPKRRLALVRCGVDVGMAKQGVSADVGAMVMAADAMAATVAPRQAPPSASTATKSRQALVRCGSMILSARMLLRRALKASAPASADSATSASSAARHRPRRTFCENIAAVETPAACAKARASSAARALGIRSRPAFGTETASAASAAARTSPRPPRQSAAAVAAAAQHSGFLYTLSGTSWAAAVHASHAPWPKAASTRSFRREGS